MWFLINIILRRFSFIFLHIFYKEITKCIKFASGVVLVMLYLSWFKDLWKSNVFLTCQTHKQNTFYTLTHPSWFCLEWLETNIWIYVNIYIQKLILWGGCYAKFLEVWVTQLESGAMDIFYLMPLHFQNLPLPQTLEDAHIIY